MLLLSKVYAAIKKIPEDFGYRHLAYKFQNDRVDVIIISKHGDERKAKSMILFCQQNLPKPIITYGEKGVNEIVPFDENLLLDDYHIALIGAPCIPVIANENEADLSLNTKAFASRNYLDYYVYRNNFIIKELLRERFVSRRKLIVIGQYEGSSVASKMASLNKKITHLIYCCGNPYGQIANAIVKPETHLDPETIFDDWKMVVSNSESPSFCNSDKTIYDFSIPQRNNLMALEIPTLISYFKDGCTSIFNDLLHLEAINERKRHLTFRSYDRRINENVLANDWNEWLTNHNE